MQEEAIILKLAVPDQQSCSPKKSSQRVSDCEDGNPEESKQAKWKQKLVQKDLQRTRTYFEKQSSEQDKVPDVKVLLKIVFGERIKFIAKLPRSLEDMRLLAAEAFRIIEGKQLIDELEQRDQEIVNSLSFVYIDPQGDKMIVEHDQDLENILVFADLAKQKILKVLMQSSCQEISALHQQIVVPVPIASPFKSAQQQATAAIVANAQLLKQPGSQLNQEQQHMAMTYLSQQRGQQSGPIKAQSQLSQLAGQKRLHSQAVQLEQHQIQSQTLSQIQQDQPASVVPQSAPNSQASTITTITTSGGYEIDRVIIRDKYCYNVNVKYHDKVYYKCQDAKVLNCKGVWRLVPLGENKDPYGTLFKEHTESLENHTYFQTTQKDELAKKQLREEEIDSAVLHFIKQSIEKAVEDDFEVTIEELTNTFKLSSEIGESVQLMQVVIADLVQETKKKLKLEKHGLIDIKNVKNLRGEAFGRAIVPKEPNDANHQKAKLMLSSPFEVKIVKQNEKQDHHVLIDTQIIIPENEAHTSRYNYKMMLTLWLYDTRTLQMMPFGQALTQGTDELTLEYILNWFKKQFADFLKPKTINVSCKDREQTDILIKASFKVFQNVPIQSSLFNFQRQLYQHHIQKARGIDRRVQAKLFYTLTFLQLAEPEATQLLLSNLKAHPHLQASEAQKVIAEVEAEYFTQKSQGIWNQHQQINTHRHLFFAIQRNSENAITLANQQFWPLSPTKTNLSAILENACALENTKFLEHKDADDRCHGNKSLLHEYNMRGFNPHYRGNLLSKWLEESLLEGDAVEAARLQDLIIREVEKPIADYCKFIDTPESHFNRLASVIQFTGATAEQAKAEEPSEDFQEPPKDEEAQQQQDTEMTQEEEERIELEQ